MAETQKSPAPQITWRQRLWRVARRVAKTMLAIVVSYVVLLVIGLIPVNNNFTPTPDGIEIFVVSNAVHADVIVPIVSEVIDWREFFPAELFPGNMRGATHVAVGWGDRGFFLKTRTWDDLKTSTVLHALLWPSSTCLHVDFVTLNNLAEGYRAVQISTDQYTRLVDFIKGSFVMDADGTPSLIEGITYGFTDGFYEAHGTYHCLNTCNCWVDRALKTAGVRAPLFAPMPKTVFMYLP